MWAVYNPDLPEELTVVPAILLPNVYWGGHLFFSMTIIAAVIINLVFLICWSVIHGIPLKVKRGHQFEKDQISFRLNRQTNENILWNFVFMYDNSSKDIHQIPVMEE